MICLRLQEGKCLKNHLSNCLKVIERIKQERRAFSQVIRGPNMATEKRIEERVAYHSVFQISTYPQNYMKVLDGHQMLAYAQSHYLLVMHPDVAAIAQKPLQH